MGKRLHRQIPLAGILPVPPDLHALIDGLCENARESQRYYFDEEDCKNLGMGILLFRLSFLSSSTTPSFSLFISPLNRPVTRLRPLRIDARLPTSPWLTNPFRSAKDVPVGDGVAYTEGVFELCAELGLRILLAGVLAPKNRDVR